MPYVITATWQTNSPIRSTTESIALVPSWSRTEIVSRVAVATLEEARRDLRLLVSGFYTRQSPYTHGQDWSPWRVSNGPDDPDFADVFPESGGTVGPLPDGTIIEVSRVSEWDLLRDIGPMRRADVADGRTDVLAAFNAS